MDITLKGLINKSMVVYLDDITIYSKNRDDHILHLREIFEQCQQYKILLNPKKSIFSTKQGKLLGFVISPYENTIDSGRTEAIKSISPPHSKKKMQSFLGKINFVRRFTFYFFEIFSYSKK